MENLNKYKYYPSYRTLFEKEILEKGYEYVFDEYIFKGDEKANIMFGRLYAGRSIVLSTTASEILKLVIGVLHPLIHLGYGTEFQQPAIVAEALGQTAIHSPWLDKFFPAVEEAAKKDHIHSKSLVTILDDIFADQELSTAAHWDDKDLTRDGIFARAWDSMIRHASHWRVDINKLEEATAEIANAAGKTWPQLPPYASYH